jgi:hypothetical protein
MKNGLKDLIVFLLFILGAVILFFTFELNIEKLGDILNTRPR